MTVRNLSKLTETHTKQYRVEYVPGKAKKNPNESETETQINL